MGRTQIQRIWKEESNVPVKSWRICVRKTEATDGKFVRKVHFSATSLELSSINSLPLQQPVQSVLQERGWVNSMPSVPRDKNAAANLQLLFSGPETKTAAAQWPGAEGFSRHRPLRAPSKASHLIRQLRPLLSAVGGKNRTWDRQASEQSEAGSWRLAGGRKLKFSDTTECYCVEKQGRRVFFWLFHERMRQERQRGGKRTEWLQQKSWNKGCLINCRLNCEVHVDCTITATTTEQWHHQHLEWFPINFQDFPSAAKREISWKN